MKAKGLLAASLAIAATASCNSLALPDRSDPDGEAASVLRMVKVSRDTISILQEETYVLHASYYPDGAVGTGVRWKSLDGQVAAVDEEGVVTGVGFGSTHVVATSLDGVLTDSCVVKVLSNRRVEEVRLDVCEASMKVGERLRLTATVLPEDARVRDVTWDSSAPEVATVTERGTVVALSPGEADVTATTVEGGKTVVCHVTVSRVEVTSVTLTPEEAGLHPGEFVQLKATVKPFNATFPGVVWSSSDSDVATVTETGLVTAVSVGVVTVTATTEDGGFTAACTVTVTEIPANQTVLVFDLTVCPESLTTVLAGITKGTPSGGDFTMMADDNNEYGWYLYYGDGTSGRPSHNGSYLVINAGTYLGTPVIEGARLKSLTFTQSAKTSSVRKAAITSETHDGTVQKSYYDASVEADGASIVAGTKNAAYTFTIKNPAVGTRYYLVCGAAGLGISKIVLVYESET